MAKGTKRAGLNMGPLFLGMRCVHSFNNDTRELGARSAAFLEGHVEGGAAGALLPA
jgi:hypothetical protein